MGAEAPRILQEEATTGDTSSETQNQSIFKIDAMETAWADVLPRTSSIPNVAKYRGIKIKPKAAANFTVSLVTARSSDSTCIDGSSRFTMLKYKQTSCQNHH